MLSLLENAILAQGELGGFEVILDKPLDLSPQATARATTQAIAQTAIRQVMPPNQKQTVPLPKPQSPPQKVVLPATPKVIPKNLTLSPIKNASYLLILRSPSELSSEAKTLLTNFFANIAKVNLNDCAIVFFTENDKKVMPREQISLKNSLSEEVKNLNPERIIFFGSKFLFPIWERNDFAESAGALNKFAEKPAIILYSPLEMLTDETLKKETWKIHIPRSGWF
ncbi:hypothetical protein AGMMS49938_17210 [Fibrobacterales bacterium]|nr:hypothetical protein AGMMS49938_17210 [Fibrobacterales bacterium]